MEEKILSLIRNRELTRIADDLTGLLRYAIRMQTRLVADEAELALDTSKIGGLPELPPDIAWPEWDDRPLLLNDLPDAERQALLGAGVAHEQDVGLCRHDWCVKLAEGNLPPCSLCEHLVSGPEYLAAWEREKVFREQQLERLAITPGAQLLQVM